jgi:hypothetical protein
MVDIASNAATPVSIMNLEGSSAGAAKVGINRSVGSTPPSTLTVEGDISASGEVYAVSASFGTLTNTTNRWNDGWHGNDEYIGLTPVDFMFHDQGANTRWYGPWVRGPAHIRVHPNASGEKLYAMKMIPKGFTATSAIVYSSEDRTVNAYSGSIVGQGVDYGLGAGNANTIDAFSADVLGTGENFVSLEYVRAGGTDTIWGGKIFIERTT